MAHLPSYVEFENPEWGGDDVYGAESRTTDSFYVPSEELVADVLTKATIGAKFRYLRAKLLGQDE